MKYIFLIILMSTNVLFAPNRIQVDAGEINVNQLNGLMSDVKRTVKFHKNMRMATFSLCVLAMVMSSIGALVDPTNPTEQFIINQFSGLAQLSFLSGALIGIRLFDTCMGRMDLNGIIAKLNTINFSHAHEAV